MGGSKKLTFRDDFEVTPGDENENGLSPVIQRPVKSFEIIDEETKPSSSRNQLNPLQSPEFLQKKKDRHVSGPKAVFRCIPVRVKTRLDTLAAEVGAPVGLVARYFFDFGVRDFENGQLELQAKVSIIGLTLYPEDQKHAGRPIEKSKLRHTSKNVTFHGVPPELTDDIRAIANKVQVNIGEVARFLLEYGIDLHQKNKRRVTRDVMIVYAQNAYQLNSYAPRFHKGDNEFPKMRNSF